jgi:hypothetical protein
MVLTLGLLGLLAAGAAVRQRADLLWPRGRGRSPLAGGKGPRRPEEAVAGWHTPAQAGPDFQRPGSKEGRGHGFPSVPRTAALCLGLCDDGAEPERASDPGPEARQPPASGRVALEAAPETQSVPETRPAPPEALAERKPKPEPAGEDWPPPLPPEPWERERRPECEPQRVKHRGGNDPHNRCADKIPNNSFPGWDVFVHGKNFDALQLATRTLWDVKTDDFGKHSPHSQKFFVKMKLGELQREARLARECGYDFIVGVHSEAHKTALLFADPSLEVVVMDWC